MIDDLIRLVFRCVEEEAAGDTAVVLNRFEQLLFLLFAHAGQDANFAFARQLLHALHIADLVRTPDEGNGLRAQALDLQQVEHRGPVFFQQLGMYGETAVLEHLLQVLQHAFADAGNFEHLLGLVDQLSNLLRQLFNGLGGVAVGTDAERILAVDFEQVGGFVKNARDGLVVHAEVKIKQVGARGLERGQSLPERSRRTPTLQKGKPGHASWGNGPEKLGESARPYEALVTLAACGPFWPWVISNSTLSPSCRLL